MKQIIIPLIFFHDLISFISKNGIETIFDYVRWLFHCHQRYYKSLLHGGVFNWYSYSAIKIIRRLA